MAFALRAFSWEKGLGLRVTKHSHIDLIISFHLDIVEISHINLINFVDIRDLDSFTSVSFGYLGINLFSFVGISSFNVGSVAMSFIIESVIANFIAIDSAVNFVETRSAVNYIGVNYVAIKY